MAPEQPTLFGDPTGGPSPDEALVVAYQSTGRTLDDLPYTDDFEKIYRALPAGWGSKRDVFHRLHNLRKAGKLPRLGKPESRPPRIDPGEEEVLRGLVVAAAGSLGQRDQLPYAPAMDALVQDFNGRTGRNMDPHDVWRLVAKLAK